MSLSRTMEVLNFLKFWKPSISETELSFRDGEDSFFDLKMIGSPAFCHKNGGEPNNRAMQQNNGVNSNRKILPIEYSFRPQSPIALLKSAPKLSLFASRNQKLTVAREVDEPELEKNREKENRGVPIKYYRESRSSHGEISTTKLNLMKLLYPKLSRKSTEKSINTEKISASSSPSGASVSSPVKEKLGNIPQSVRQVRRHLSKSKSTSASAKNSVEHRKGNPFLQYEDAIESAILHCKRSLNSSNDSSIAQRHRGRVEREEIEFVEGEEIIRV